MASTSRLLLLRRGDHNSRLTEGFESLLDKESMTDVSITCGQQILKAHRTVLSIFSPFFKRVFDSVQNPLHYPFIVLKDMPYADLRAIIDLMYRGEVTVTQEQFSSLKKSAKVLEVSELSDIISSYEEKNDIKPKLEDNSLVGRNTRKRGRPRRYCEDSDEDYKILDTPPPTKRQQALQSSKAIATSLKKTIVPTITAAKPQTASRGGAHSLSFSKQPNVRVPTAIRGGHSAFSKPQTAIRGGHSAVTLTKPQIATRGGVKGTLSSRGRPVRQSVQEIDEDFHPSQEVIRRSTGRRGRPPRTSSLTREGTGMPMATSLPVSLPEPIQVDLGNIFPNYNLNDVTSSTSSISKDTVPVQFEQTIKQEPDSDSEVECIMSGTSPLPSGVMDDVPEITESSSQEIERNAVPQPEPQIIDTQKQTEADPSVNEITERREVTPESIRNESESNEIEIESHILPQNIVIKTERPDSLSPQPLNTTEEDSAVSTISTDNTENITDINRVVTTPTETTESVAATTASVSSISCVDRNIPLLRIIKTERISPTPTQTSFQPIAGQTNDESNSCEVTSDTIVPVLTRVKIERISPKEVIENNTNNISIENENSSAANDSSDVTSSHIQELNVQITNVFSENQRPETSQTNDVTTNESINECTSSSNQQTSDENNKQQQNIGDNSNANNEIDVQDIAFDCFYSNDDQQMQTYSTEVATSSLSFPTSDVNTFNVENTNNLQNNDFSQIISNPNPISFTPTSATNSMISSSHSTQQFFAVNTTQPQMSNTSNTNNFSIDNNVVMNSPLHSDEECMLLDSPQQSTAYEVTIGSEPNLDDSMDNL